MNHNPGVWLESVACPQCGARFGDPKPPRLDESSPVVPPRPRPTAVRRPPPPPADRETDLGPWGPVAPTELDRDSSRAAAPESWRILLGAMAAAARARTESAERSSDDEIAPVRRRGGGCVGRIFMLILFLIALFLMAPLFLGALLGFR